MGAYIVRNCGRSIEKDCEWHVSNYGEVEYGTCMETWAGDLDAKYIIHAVVPIYNPYEPEEGQRLL